MNAYELVELERRLSALVRSDPFLHFSFVRLLLARIDPRRRTLRPADACFWTHG